MAATAGSLDVTNLIKEELKNEIKIQAFLYAFAQKASSMMPSFIEALLLNKKLLQGVECDLQKMEELKSEKVQPFIDLMKETLEKLKTFNSKGAEERREPKGEFNSKMASFMNESAQQLAALASDERFNNWHDQARLIGFVCVLGSFLYCERKDSTIGHRYPVRNYCIGYMASDSIPVLYHERTVPTVGNSHFIGTFVETISKVALGKPTSEKEWQEYYSIICNTYFLKKCDGALFIDAFSTIATKIFPENQSASNSIRKGVTDIEKEKLIEATRARNSVLRGPQSFYYHDTTEGPSSDGQSLYLGTSILMLLVAS
jgi:hypothetical protein